MRCVSVCGPGFAFDTFDSWGVVYFNKTTSDAFSHLFVCAGCVIMHGM